MRTNPPIPKHLQLLLRGANVQGGQIEEKLKDRARAQILTYLNIVFMRLDSKHVEEQCLANMQDIQTLQQVQEASTVAVKRSQMLE